MAEIKENLFDFLNKNDRPKKPRTKGITEIRGPYYSVMGRNYLSDVLETMGGFIDSLKFAGGSFALIPPRHVKELIDLAHRHDVLVSTGGFVEFVLTRGKEAVKKYFEACKVLEFDIIEISAGFIVIPTDDWLRLIEAVQKSGLKAKPEVGIQFGAGGDTPQEALREEGVIDTEWAIGRAKKFIDAGAYMIMIESPIAAAPATEQGPAVQGELQVIADRLAARMQLPPGMQVRVGYADSKTINAFATLGGQTVFFRGLLARLDSEDALAMVMAHEIAHLKHRHATAALGRGVAVGVILSVVSAELGRSAAAGVLSQAGLATTLSFNRDQEREADDDALAVVAAEYGHLGGAVDLFRTVAALPGAGSPAQQVELLRTHPLTRSRQSAIGEWARRHGIALEGARRPLPAAVAALRAGP